MNRYLATAGLGVLIAAGLGVGAPMANAAAPHATHTSCKFAGSVTITPGLLATKDQVETAKLNAGSKFNGCVGGGVTSGTASGSVKSPKASCTAGTYAGTLAVKWNTGKTSSAAVTLKRVNLGSFGVSGKVKTGLFAGDTLSGALSITPTTPGADCISKAIKAAKLAGPFKL